MKKQFEYWSAVDGQPIKMKTDWFEWDTDFCPKWQMKRKLLNWYK